MSWDATTRRRSGGTTGDTWSSQGGPTPRGTPCPTGPPDRASKIVVITHIDQVKESCPVRIEVTKTGSGSMFEVV